MLVLINTRTHLSKGASPQSLVVSLVNLQSPLYPSIPSFNPLLHVLDALMTKECLLLATNSNNTGFDNTFS